MSSSQARYVGGKPAVAKIQAILRVAWVRVLSALAFDPAKVNARAIVDGVLAFVLFLSSLVAISHWYDWSQGEDLAIGIPILWTATMAASLIIAREKRLVVLWCLALYAGRFALGALVNQEPRGLFIGLLAFTAVLLMLRYAPPRSPRS